MQGKHPFVERFETSWTIGITGGTLSNTSKIFTFRGLSNLRAVVKTNIRTEVKTKEETVTATMTEKLVLFFIVHWKH